MSRCRSGAVLLWAAALGCGACAGTRPSPMEQRAEALILNAPDRTGDLRLSCVPQDAEVSVDGVPQGTCLDFAGTPRGLELGDGMHEIAVRSPGHQPYVSYYAPGGTRGALNIRLKPAPASQGAP